MDKQSLPGLHTDAGLLFLWNYLIAHQNAGVAQAPLDGNALAFLAHCLRDFSRSKACYLQDLYATYKLGNRQEGFFVEFGATDGVLLSNTYYLEKCLDWDGILAEPLPDWNRRLVLNRSANIDKRCVWRESGETLEFLVAKRHPELSSLKGFGTADSYAEARLAESETIAVETVSLNDLLIENDAPDTIDYMSIDTEGSELDILDAFDFDRFKVRVMTIEHNFTDARDRIHRLLASKGFVREFEIFSKNDDWYFHPQRV